MWQVNYVVPFIKKHQFDEKGNMKNWWTKEDFTEFNKRTQAVIDIYDGLKYGPAKLNGQQIVSENIADLGGLTCAIQACKMDNGDLKTILVHGCSCSSTNTG